MHIYSGELKQWLRITFNLHEGPWQRARRFTANLIDVATEVSSIGWEGVANAGSGSVLGGVSRKSNHPEILTARSLRKAARGPATRSGLD